MSFRRVPIALLAVLAVVALVPAIASAGSNSTKIVLSIKFPAFHGKLTSPRQACLGSRTVKMYRKHKGKTVQVGKDKSADSGNWKIPVGKKVPPPGQYFATVAARGKCQPAKSKTLTIPG
jgi:hypothetical protein